MSTALRGDAFFRVEGLSKKFAGLQALGGVSFDLRGGDMLGVVGPNGAGKTTLLNCISGSVRPDAGTVILDDRELAGKSAAAVARAGIARTFQMAEHFRDLTVLDLALLGRLQHTPTSVWACGLRLPGARRRETREREVAEQYLHDFGLSAEKDLPLHELPYGKQKLADLVRAVASEPAVLLLDEPTSGSSDAERRDLAAVIGLLKERGVTTVVIDHDVAFIERTCERALAMASGRQIALGPTSTVLADAEVRESYFGATT